MSSPLPRHFFSFQLVILMTSIVCAVTSSTGPPSDPVHSPDIARAHDKSMRKPVVNSLPRISLYSFRRGAKGRHSKHNAVDIPKDKSKHSSFDTVDTSEPTSTSSNMYSEQPPDSQLSHNPRHSGGFSNNQASGGNENSQSTIPGAKDRPVPLENKSYHRIINPSELEDVMRSHAASGNGVGKVSRCPTCERLSRDRNHRIESLKRQILKSTRLTKIPNATGMARPKLPSLAHLMDQDGNMMNDEPKRKRGSGGRYAEDDDDFAVKTDRVYTYARKSPMAEHFNLTDTLYFSPHAQLYTSKIKTAYLWFYIRKDSRQGSKTLTVERILPESRADNKPILKTVYHQKLLRDKASGWKRIDVRDTLRRWLRHPMGNYGLVMRALDDRGNNLIVLPPYNEAFKGYEPWLETKIIEGKSNSRHRRDESRQCNENSTETRCCRYPLTLSFHQFGWDWIIAPSFVNADQCSGDCTISLESTGYTWMAQQTSEGHEACCAPTKQSALSLLYFDESMNIVFQILQGIKVEKCGCR